MSSHLSHFHASLTMANILEHTSIGSRHACSVKAASIIPFVVEVAYEQRSDETSQASPELSPEPSPVEPETERVVLSKEEIEALRRYSASVKNFSQFIRYHHYMACHAISYAFVFYFPSFVSLPTVRELQTGARTQKGGGKCTATKVPPEEVATG